MKVVILAGGYGTRLSEETLITPKPLIEIGNRPILWHIMKIYSSFGYNDFIICLGYKGDKIKDYFANYFLNQSDVTYDFSKFNQKVIHNYKVEPWKVTLVDTGLDTQTGGRIKRIQKYIGNESFMLTYGDGVSDVNIKELVDFHKSHNKVATVMAAQPSGRFGALQIRENNQIQGFEEKPQGDGRWVNAGFFVMKPEVFEYIQGDETVLEKSPLEELTNDGQLMAFKHSGFWYPMDTLKDKKYLDSLWKSGCAPWKKIIESKFWNGKRVLLTGHTGFKGSWLSLWLHSLGANITGYALEPPTEPSLFKVCKINKIINSIIGDMRDREKLQRVIKQVNPDIVFHLAAQPLVHKSYKTPVETYSINVMGTIYLLDAVKTLSRQDNRVRGIVNVTSDKCYENKEWFWGYRECDSLGGYDPYSNSKACSELVTSSYRNSFFSLDSYGSHGVGLATARAGNVIGGGDWAKDRLIPDCIRALLNGDMLKIRNPSSIRPWQHVLEPLSGYLKLAEKLYLKGPVYADAWNFGPFEEELRSVEWIVDNISKKWDGDFYYEYEKENHPHETKILKLDSSKAIKELDWYPKWNTEESIDKVIEWAIAFREGQDMKKQCLHQISEYCSK